MNEKIKDIFECLKKYTNLTPDAIDDLHYLERTIESLQQKVEQLENIKKEDIEYVDFNKLLDILNKGYYKNGRKGEKHD